MKSSIDYLPEHKQKEITNICSVIVEMLNPDMVILFGSYARGNWVEDKYIEYGHTYEYKSDYDILIITETNLNSNQLMSQWRKTERKVEDLANSVSVNLIHHSHGFIKKELLEGSYFFTDVIREGILLYNNGRNFPLELPDKLDPEKVKARAKEEFEYWFKSAKGFYIDFQNAFSREDYRIAAFHLHQSAERFYTALLLVFTGYKAKTHNLIDLNTQAEVIDPKFKRVFPRDTEEGEYRFKLLKKAYIDARYKKNYNISKEDLEYLSVCVENLHDSVKIVCESKLL